MFVLIKQFHYTNVKPSNQYIVNDLEYMVVHGTVDLAVNAPSSNLFPELCAHWTWADNSFYSIDHTHTLPIVLSMISIAEPRDNNNES